MNIATTPEYNLELASKYRSIASEIYRLRAQFPGINMDLIVGASWVDVANRQARAKALLAQALELIAENVDILEGRE